MKRAQRPSSREPRPKNGTRPQSTLSPSRERTAGSTVREPTIAASTTIIVPSPIVANSEFPETNIPAIAISTVAPEIRTACPEVLAASEQGLVRGPAPASLLPLPPQVEQRVVDPDRHADHQDDRAQRLRRRSGRRG